MTNHPSHAAKVQKLFHTKEKKTQKTAFHTPLTPFLFPPPKQRLTPKRQPFLLSFLFYSDPKTYASVLIISYLHILFLCKNIKNTVFLPLIKRKRLRQTITPVLPAILIRLHDQRSLTYTPTPCQHCKLSRPLRDISYFSQLINLIFSIEELHIPLFTIALDHCRFSKKEKNSAVPNPAFRLQNYNFFGN